MEKDFITTREFPADAFSGIHTLRAVENKALAPVKPDAAQVVNPHIGHDASTSIAREALSSGRSVTCLALERGLPSTEELGDLLLPDCLASLQRKAASSL